MQSVKRAFMCNCDGNSVVEDIKNIFIRSELPEEWKSEPWNNFVTEMLSYEMDTRKMKRNCVEVWQAYERRWHKLLPDLKASMAYPVYAGSYAEGMPNAGDLDMICVATWTEAYEFFGKLRDNVTSLPFIADLCHPGYIKLIVPSITRRNYDHKDYQVKKDGRHHYLSSTGFVRTMKEWGTTGYNHDVNGPALTEEGVEGTSSDIVHAIKCVIWPSFANDIFLRTCFNGDVEKIKQLSVYAVATGHALSLHNDLEWRLSFTEAEKVLVREWTETQYNCYYLIKHLKMIHLKNTDVLCSYFIKTVILWISDVVPNAYWIESRQMEFLFKTLHILQIMYRYHYLPNYFIPQNNMIDHKSKEDCLVLADEINDILLSGRIRIVIAELLCENDVEVIFLSSINMDVKHARHKSCRILCKTVRKYCESSRTFYEQLVINEAQLLSSLTTMMPIWNRTQCKALEDILAILSNIVSLEFSCAFRTVITRLIADFYHSLCTRQSMKKAETFYRESFTLIYPCKFNDGHISGRVQFALFYYLNGDYTVALSEINKIHPAIVDVIKNNKVDCYLNLSFPVWLKDRFFHDEFLARLVSALLTNFPFIVNVVVIGIYIMIKCIVKICPKERQDDVFALYSLLRECEDQQCTPTACDSYQMIADNLSDTVKEIYHIIQLPPTVKNGMPFTRNQAVKQYWDDW